MSRDKNSVILQGNLVADPELRYTQSGIGVTNFRLATNEHYKNKEGKDVVQTEFSRVVCFGKLAESVAKYRKKGSRVEVEGKLQTRKWVDKDGQTRFTTEIKANLVDFINLAKREGTTEEVPQEELFDEQPPQA